VRLFFTLYDGISLLDFSQAKQIITSQGSVALSTQKVLWVKITMVIRTRFVQLSKQSQM